MTDSQRKPVTVPDLLALRQSGHKLSMLTCYDAGFARTLDSAGVDLILVGDSLGMVVQGGPSTLEVKVEDIGVHLASRPGPWCYQCHCGYPVVVY